MADFDSVDEVLDEIMNEMKNEYDFRISWGKEKEVKTERGKGEAIELIHETSDSIFYVPLDLNFYNEDRDGISGFDIIRTMIFENLWYKRHKKWPWEEDEDPRNEDLLNVYEKNPDLDEEVEENE